MEGISPYDIPDLPELTLVNVNSRLHPKLLANPDWQELRKDLQDQVKIDYRMNWQKAAVNYILMDPFEKMRLRIHSIPFTPANKVIRAPVPWHDAFVSAHETQLQQLFISSEVMVQIQLLWWNKLVHK